MNFFYFKAINICNTYYALDYLRPSSPFEPPSFIIIEEHQPLNSEKLKELNAVALILNNHLTCAYVPASFPLNKNLNKNTLVLIEGVMFEAVKNISSIFTTPATTSIIDSLQKTIDLCLTIENPIIHPLQHHLAVLHKPLTLYLLFMY